MKKLFTIGVLLALFLTAAQAQNTLWPRHRSVSFLNASAVYVTNTMNLTNLTIGTTGTNVAGTTYTNAAGTRITTTATSGETFNLLGSAPLFVLADGSPPYGGTNINAWNAVAANYGNISYNIVGGSGANAAVTFTFAPSWDGVNVDTSGSYDFVFSVTATTTTAIKSATNAPLHKWLGAKAIFAKTIINADTDASSQVILRDLKFNAFAPP